MADELGGFWPEITLDGVCFDRKVLTFEQHIHLKS